MSRRDDIHDALVTAFAPTVLEVINESHNHAVPPGSETHWKVVIVSEAFAGRSPIDRHRAVNKAVDTLPDRKRIHALSIQPFTPEQWAERGGEVPPSPPCLGGSKAEGG